MGRLTDQLERREGVRQIYMDITFGDLLFPQRGQYIQAFGKKGPGSSYRILRSRRVKRRDPKARPRFNLLVRKIVDIPHSAPFIFELTWYKRTKKRSHLLSPLP